MFVITLWEKPFFDNLSPERMAKAGFLYRGSDDRTCQNQEGVNHFIIFGFQVTTLERGPLEFSYPPLRYCLSGVVIEVASHPIGSGTRWLRTSAVKGLLKFNHELIDKKYVTWAIFKDLITLLAHLK